MILPAGLPPARWEPRQLQSQGGQAGEWWRSQPRTDLCKGRASARDRRGAAQCTHRDVKEHLDCEAGETRASTPRHARQQPGQLAGVLNGARPCIGALRRAPTRTFRTFFVTLGAAATVVAEKALHERARSANCKMSVCGSSAPCVAIASREDECRSVETESHAPARGGRGAARRRQRRRQPTRAQRRGAHDSGRHWREGRREGARSREQSGQVV